MNITAARTRIALAAVAVALSACQARNDDAAFGEKVRAYLLAHPEVLQEAGERLAAKTAESAEADQRAAEALLPKVRAAVERDPRDFVANPAGKITVTEFYDYRCPHCADAAPKVIALVRANPDVRVVFKETPVFGPTSERAAAAALAVKIAGGDSLGLYQDLMATADLDNDTIDRLARQHGAPAAALQARPTAEAAAHLAQTADLFNQLSLRGTPAFIVGDHIIIGENMAAVNADIARARAAAKSAPAAASNGLEPG